MENVSSEEILIIIIIIMIIIIIIIITETYIAKQILEGNVIAFKYIFS